MHSLIPLPPDDCLKCGLFPIWSSNQLGKVEWDKTLLKYSHSSTSNANSFNTNARKNNNGRWNQNWLKSKFKSFYYPQKYPIYRKAEFDFDGYMSKIHNIYSWRKFESFCLIPQNIILKILPLQLAQDQTSAKSPHSSATNLTSFDQSLFKRSCPHLFPQQMYYKWRNISFITSWNQKREFECMRLWGEVQGSRSMSFWDVQIFMFSSAQE